MTKAGYVLTALLVVLLSTPVFATTPWATRDDDGRAGASQAAPSRVAPLLELWRSVATILGLDQQARAASPIVPTSVPDLLSSDSPSDGDHGGSLDPNG